MRTGLPLTVLVSCALLGLAACGEDPGRNAERYDGDKRDVAQVVDDLEAASRKGDPGKICKSLLTDELARRIEAQNQTTCEDRLRRQVVSKERRFNVQSVDMDGDESARARVEDQAGNASVLELRKSDDEWRIAEIAAAS